jgi:Glycerol-3-phosphate dehydrogenase
LPKVFQPRKAPTNAPANFQVETPIIDQIYSVVYEGKRPADAMQELLARDQKAERG